MIHPLCLWVIVLFQVILVSSSPNPSAVSWFFIIITGMIAFGYTMAFQIMRKDHG